MLRVGLTGGIACGKSHVLRRLAERGLHSLDLDEVAHRVTAPGGPAHAAVVAAFGPGILLPDGALDRRKLGARVFGDARARATLNAIVHPVVREEEARWAARFAAVAGAVVVTDAALLVETGAHLRFDRLVVVHCEPGEQLRRLRARDGLDEAAARARLDAQMPVAEKRRFAHHEVDTSGTLADTDATSDRLAHDLLAVALPPRIDVPSERVLGCLLHGPEAGPRGLTPVAVLGDIVGAQGLEMERVFRLLAPPAPGPWYRAPGDDPVPPETLAGPLALWALVRGGPDPAFLAGAAFSLARLTHREESALADACLFALVLQAVGVAGSLGAGLEARHREWADLASRWAGAPPAGRALAAWKAAAAHPRDPGTAREAGRAAGIEPGLAGALVGLAAGPGREPSPLLAGLGRGLEALRGVR